MGARNQHRYSFGAFLLDPVEKVLLRDNLPVHLPLKAFETLLALVENEGHIVGKPELLRRVWPDTFVEEATLAQNIFTLRKTLANGGGGKEYIETVPKRGYRFVTPVRILETAVGGEAAREIAAGQPRAFRWIWTASIAALALVVAGSWLGWRRFRRTEGATVSRTMLAVIPFENLSGDPGQDYFSDGLTEELITKFGSLSPERLGVIARTTTMQYKGTKKDVRQVGSELGVNYIVEGSVVRGKDRVRINAQLIRVRDQTHVWAQSYERDLGGVVALQDDVAAAIADAVEFRLEKPSAVSGTSHGTRNSAAYEAYLEGRYFWNERSEQGHLKAIQYFKQAIADDPQYAEAYSGLADAYALLGSNPTAVISRHDAMEKAREAAQKALSLNDRLVEAHTSLAFIEWHYDWNWTAAEKEFRLALQIDPSYATAHHWYAYYLMAQGRPEESLGEIRAAQRLDPLSLIINTDVAEMLFYAGRYDESIQQAERVLEMDPNFVLAMNVIAWTYVKERKYDDALQEVRRAMSVPGAGRAMEGSLAESYALAGQTAMARKLLARMQVESETLHRQGLWVSIASTYAALGDRDEAFAWLEKAVQARDGGLTLIERLPFLDSLHSDPRFADLVRRIGLPLQKG